MRDHGVSIARFGALYVLTFALGHKDTDFRNFSKYFFRDIPILEMNCYICAMTKEERILRFKWPDRTEFTDEEIREVKRLLSREDEKDESASRLPVKFVPVGGVTAFKGRRYLCILASKDILTDPCLGCDIGGENCTSKAPQCSPFDRKDRKRVWFRLLDDDGK